MNGKYLLYIDQYGSRIWAASRKELVERAGGGRVSKMTKKTAAPFTLGTLLEKGGLPVISPMKNSPKV